MYLAPFQCPAILKTVINLETSMVNCKSCETKRIRHVWDPGGRGVLPSKRLLGMCRWMGSHFHNWTDYNGVTFLVELLEWGRKFSGFLG